MNEIAESVQAMDPIQNFLQRERKSESETHCSLECPNIDCIDTSNNDSFPLVIGEGQGLVELHIVSLQLSTSVSSNTKRHIPSLNSWYKFWEILIVTRLSRYFSKRRILVTCRCTWVGAFGIRKLPIRPPSSVPNWTSTHRSSTESLISSPFSTTSF